MEEDCYMTRVTIYYTPSVAGFPGTSSITIEVSVSFMDVLCNISLFDMLPKRVTYHFLNFCAPNLFTSSLEIIL